jgi:hypothetical protein
MTPDSLLADADRLLREVLPQSRGRWPRVCVWLIRLALERALQDFWAAREPQIADAPRRAQLLLLDRYAGSDVARAATAAWAGLSRAAHHHPYELAPTAGELRSWQITVRGVCDELAAAAQGVRAR